MGQQRWKDDDAMAMGQAVPQWRCLIPEAGGVIMVGTAAVGHNRLIAAESFIYLGYAENFIYSYNSTLQSSHKTR
jgi:hypothetical protein